MLSRLYRRRYLYLILAFILFIFGRMTYGYFQDAVKIYVNQKANNYSEEIIVLAIKEEVIPLLGDDGLMETFFDESGKVSYSKLNTTKSNQILTKASECLNNSINKINNHVNFTYVKIPFGYFFSKNIFLTNGIRVPVDIEVVGSHSIDIVPEVSEYSINSSLVVINLVIKIEVQVMIPFQSDVLVADSIIPLSLEIMNNDVPNFYVND